MTITNLNSEQEYKDYIKSQNLSVVHFYAPWADQCSQIDDVIMELSKLNKYERVKFAKIEAEKVPDVSLDIGITAVPTVVLAVNNTVLEKIEGAYPSAITEKIQLYFSEKLNKDLKQRLKELINSASCMLFMKGNPENPRYVREGLKIYSEWPTYPQLYLNGEFIGGLDIVKQILEDKEWHKQLPKK